jgi:hypothetical protein
VQNQNDGQAWSTLTWIPAAGSPNAGKVQSLTLRIGEKTTFDYRWCLSVTAPGATNTAEPSGWKIAVSPIDLGYDILENYPGPPPA